MQVAATLQRIVALGMADKAQGYMQRCQDLLAMQRTMLKEMRADIEAGGWRRKVDAPLSPSPPAHGWISLLEGWEGKEGGG